MNNNKYTLKRKNEFDMKKKFDENTEFAKEFYDPLNNVPNMFDTDKPILAKQVELKEFNNTRQKEKEI